MTELLYQSVQGGFAMFIKIAAKIGPRARDKNIFLTSVCYSLKRRSTVTLSVKFNSH